MTDRALFAPALTAKMKRFSFGTLVVGILAALGAGCGSKFKGCKGNDCAATDAATGGQGGSSGTGGAESGGSGGMASSEASEGTTASSGGTGGDGTGGMAGEASGGSGGESGGAGGTGGATGGAGGVGGGSGGTGGTPPCAGACEGATPVCDEQSDTCVECLHTVDCEEGVCDADTMECVQCLGSEDCDGELCDTEARLCVECLGNADCDDPAASTCDTGVCSPCVDNEDCAHLSGTTVCDDGECVQCTIAEEAVCEGTSCDPATLTCTETEVGSVDDCGRCAADSECIGGNQSDPERRCVPMEFDGEAREGGYCLRRQSQTCSRPYAIVINATSLSGALQEAYCGIDEDSVTCEAVVDLLSSRACPEGEDSECGCPRDEDGNCTEAGEGGLCRTVGVFENQCSYQCGAENRCPSDFSCANQDPDFCQ